MSSPKHNIGSLKERSLHAALKKWYARAGDNLEEQVDGSIIDIVRGDELIEIQTRNFSALRKKFTKLLENHKIRLIYPIPVTKWIVRVSERGKELSKKQSPKKGKLYEIFDEMLYIPEFINHPNFTLEVLLVRVEEIRCADGEGSWRRKGVSIKDSRLVEVTDSVLFTDKRDFTDFLPPNLVRPFSNKQLAASMNITAYRARRITYTLRKMEAIEIVDKKGKTLLFDITDD